MAKNTCIVICIILFSLLVASCGVSEDVQVNNAFAYLKSKERAKVQVAGESYTIKVDEGFIALFQEPAWKEGRDFVDTPEIMVYLQEEYFIYLYPNGRASIYYGYASRFEKNQEYYEVPTEVLEDVKEYIEENGPITLSPDVLLLCQSST